MLIADETTVSILVQIIAPNRLVRSGLRLLVESGPGLIVVGEAEGIGDARASTLLTSPDVIVVDIENETARSLAELCSVRSSSRVLVLTPQDDAGRRSIVPHGASGILSTHRAEESLVRAIQTVHRGGCWPPESLRSA